MQPLWPLCFPTTTHTRILFRLSTIFLISLLPFHYQSPASAVIAANIARSAFGLQTSINDGTMEISSDLGNTDDVLQLFEFHVLESHKERLSGCYITSNILEADVTKIQALSIRASTLPIPSFCESTLFHAIPSCNRLHCLDRTLPIRSPLATVTYAAALMARSFSNMNRFILALDSIISRPMSLSGAGWSTFPRHSSPLPFPPRPLRLPQWLLSSLISIQLSNAPAE